MIKALALGVVSWSLTAHTALAAERSTTLPIVAQAVRSLVDGTTSDDPLVRDVASRIASKGVSKPYLFRLVVGWQKRAAFDQGFTLPEEDEGDRLIAEAASKPDLVVDADSPKMALHAFRFDVLAKKSTVFKDDIYAYFFVTDGLVPSGKVTSIYSALKSGDSFFFSPVDRAVFPGFGVSAAVPRQHLIVDYGIIESNKGDIADMQRLSDVLVDLVIAIYGAQHPESSPILAKIRREVKALARELIAMKRDDRMVTDSIIWDQAALKQLFAGGAMVEDFSKEYAGTFGPFKDEWKYKLNFRVLKE